MWFDGSGPFYATAFFTSDQARGVAALDTETAFGRLLDQMGEMFHCDARACTGAFGGGALGLGV